MVPMDLTVHWIIAPWKGLFGMGMGSDNCRDFMLLSVATLQRAIAKYNNNIYIYVIYIYSWHHWFFAHVFCTKQMPSFAPCWTPRSSVWKNYVFEMVTSLAVWADQL
jgi:hypothetical protein